MAYEAGVRVLVDGAPTPASIISVTQAAPFGLKKLSGTLARALGIPEARPLDIGGGPAALLDAFEIGAALSASDGQPALVVASDHLVSYEERVCDILSAGGAAAFLVGAGGFARLGLSARAGREVYDVWRLGTEAEARYRLEVLFNSYAASTGEALAALERVTERATADYAAVAASQPHPQTLRGLGKAGVSAEQLSATSFVGEIGNLGAASVGVALAMGLDAAAPGDHVLALAYGGGEAIAQDIEVTAPVPVTATAAQVPGEAISVSTYYRWTRGRQAEPH
jgi:3-hydroxy-3-methylglutaryl CoA synthase